MDNVFNKQITLHDIMQTKIPPHDKKLQMHLLFYIFLTSEFAITAVTVHIKKIANTLTQ